MRCNVIFMEIGLLSTDQELISQVVYHIWRRCFIWEVYLCPAIFISALLPDSEITGFHYFLQSDSMPGFTNLLSLHNCLKTGKQNSQLTNSTE